MRVVLIPESTHYLVESQNYRGLMFLPSDTMFHEHMLVYHIFQEN